MVSTAPSIPELDRKGLREFALLSSTIIAALFGLVLPWMLDLGLPMWPWVVAGVLSGWGIIAPASLRPVYRGWMRIGLLLSRVTTPLLMGLVYFLLLVPVGAIMKVLRNDPLRRSLDDKTPSYRVASEQPPKDHMENPY